MYLHPFTFTFMHTPKFLLILAALGTCCMAAAHAQSRYDAHRAFAPLFYPQSGTPCRSASGVPGPAYWQNRADYTVTASLDTSSLELAGRVDIHYTNHSPDALGYLWLQLDQNIDRSDSHSQEQHAPGVQPVPGAGYHFRSVDLKTAHGWIPLSCLISGTRMKVELPKALKSGTALDMRIAYHFLLERNGAAGRCGYTDTPDGRIYEVSYWYPRLCVYDDLQGWNTLPFLGDGEFYLDYGSIDYTLTLPADLVVAGSGALQNPEQVLSTRERERLALARKSDTTVVIRDASDIARSAAARGLKTWHFHMDNTRDVAWAASRAFLWDAASIRLPDHKQALAMSFYPRKSAGRAAWGRATEYLQHAVEIFSRKWFVYPYPVAINVAGDVGGMEYPGITFDGWDARGKELWALLAHEIGHNWFPMIVGSNERRNAWMDEGFNTFIDVLASREFNHGEYAPKRDGEYAPGGGDPAKEIVPVMERKGIPPIVSLADAIRPQDLHPLEYFKTAYGLVLLREVILGPRRFDEAFRGYVHAWSYKHPSPMDFFHAMENGSGENLSWFWRGWFLHNWKLDQAVLGVGYVHNDPKQGALIHLENRGRLPMPVLMRVKPQGAAALSLKLPVEVWERGADWTVQLPTTTPLDSVVLDPEALLPDLDRSNNCWAAGH